LCSSIHPSWMFQDIYYISDKGQVSKILLILLHFIFLKHNNLLLREL
jgi:hypothetical protein